MDVARNAGTAIARAGLVTLSGGARGVDRAAIEGAFTAGGMAVGILGDSLERALRDFEARRRIYEGDLCLATIHSPKVGFSVAVAMARNKVIYALAERVFVVSAHEDTGGTWHGATEALRRGLGEVLVWMGDGRGPGNEELVKLGAIGVQDVTEITDRVRDQRGLSEFGALDQQLRLGI
jgi:predicted Rossmann fold nucleotide-binding protein DprA/Smf involved in DNA uptake